MYLFTRVRTPATAKSLQSCPTLCDPIDSSPPGSPVPGILQARILEWVAISFSNAWKWKVKVKSLSRVRPSATPWTAAFQAPPSMGFSRQEYWSGMPLPSLIRTPNFHFIQWVIHCYHLFWCLNFSSFGQWTAGFGFFWTCPYHSSLEKGKATHSSILAWRIPMDRGA